MDNHCQGWQRKKHWVDCWVLGHLPYRAGIWLGLKGQDLGTWREKLVFQLEKRWEGDSGVRYSEFRILPLFPVCLITLGEGFALRRRCFSCTSYLEEDMRCAYVK